MKKVYLFLLVFSCIATGCTTTIPERRKIATRQDNEISRINYDLNKLTKSVEAFASSQQEIYEQFDSIERVQAGKHKEFESRLDKLEDEIALLRRQQELLKKEIVDVLTQKMKQLFDSAGSSGVYAQGMEHVVETGQTLSQIAIAYGVTVDSLVEANKLKNPDSIRKGQKLFIPE